MTDAQARALAILRERGHLSSLGGHDVKPATLFALERLGHCTVRTSIHKANRRGGGYRRYVETFATLND